MSRFAIYASNIKTYKALCELDFRDIAIPLSLYGMACTPRYVLVNDTIGVRELLNITSSRSVEGIIVWSSSDVQVESVCRLASMLGLDCYSNLQVENIGWAVMVNNGAISTSADMTLINPGCRFMTKRCLKKLIDSVLSKN